ncbi:YdcF family protein [Phreatobacter stygius]|uniref:YdcF family protein n=1 Tax=Phreatobacter stygius TaxID=1940610 RepID=A0A4D7BMD9_9HYPH|nr:YdcF family protein [Phreatobacter stygius]QCI68937.1 YdcF family protein [Phreatobacter stygius]
MFFYASKILWWGLTPSNLLVGLIVVGVLLRATRLARWGRRFFVLGALGLVIAGPVPLGIWLARPLENRFPLMAQDMPAPSGIIVLGGSIDQVTTAARGGQVTIGAAPGRITEAVALAHRYPQARLVFSGGSNALFLRDGLDEAEAAKKLFIELGIAAERITIERESRNTWENALLSKRVVDPKPGERWILITSAYHMPRSVGIFRVAGFDVVAYPVDFETRNIERELYLPVLPVSRGLDLVDRMSREWLGLLAYRLGGRTDAVFPRP